MMYYFHSTYLMFIYIYCIRLFNSNKVLFNDTKCFIECNLNIYFVAHCVPLVLI